MFPAMRDLILMFFQYRKTRKILILFLCFISLHFFPASIPAFTLGGRAEITYNNVSTDTEDVSGLTTHTKSNSLLQLYTLTLQRSIYPNLSFQGSGTFEQGRFNNEENGSDETFYTRGKSGSADLRLNTRQITSGVGYNRAEETEGSPATTNIRENYSANLSLRPEGFPKIDTFVLRTYSFDKERELRDTVTDLFSLGLRYDPYKNLNLQYQFSLTDLNDNLQNFNVKQIVNSARSTYTRRFGERVSMSTTYSIINQTTKITAEGTGEIIFPAFPFSGLSVISDTPTLVTLDPNPAVIDGNLTASSGINIGRNPSVAGDTRLRNIGVDFINDTELNTVYLWVDRELPTVVANSFSWDIYTSSDNLNWSLHQTVSPASFGLFENRFEINFSTVTTRYIKVVTRPLSLSIIIPPGTDANNIFVTELQTFLRRPVADVKGKTEQTSQLFDLNVSWRILDNPNLYYSFYFWTSKVNPPGTSRYTISNSLNIRHRFNRVFTGAARLAREDSKETTGAKTTAHTYSTSLTAVPIPKLQHTLIVTGRFENNPAGTTNSHSVFLSNGAELYKGLSFSLSGGVNVSNSETDRKTINTIVTSGISALPHPTMTINIGYSETNTKQTGGGEADFSTFSKSSSIGATYTPFPAIYLAASYGISEKEGSKKNTVQNYALTWSPFRDGDLQLNFSYNETLSNESNAKDRTISPSLRWHFVRKAYLDFSYVLQTSESDFERSETDIYSATLNMSL